MLFLLALVFVPHVFTGGPRQGSNDIGDSIQPHGCQIQDRTSPNGNGKTADVRLSECPIDASMSYLGPAIASIFVFVHQRAERKAVGNIVLRYEKVTRITELAPSCRA